MCSSTSNLCKLHALICSSTDSSPRLNFWFYAIFNVSSRSGGNKFILSSIKVLEITPTINSSTYNHSYNKSWSISLKFCFIFKKLILLSLKSFSFVLYLNLIWEKSCYCVCVKHITRCQSPMFFFFYFSFLYQSCPGLRNCKFVFLIFKLFQNCGRRRWVQLFPKHLCKNWYNNW